MYPFMFLTILTLTIQTVTRLFLSTKKQISFVQCDSLKIVVEPVSMVPEDIQKSNMYVYMYVYGTWYFRKYI